MESVKETGKIEAAHWNIDTWQIVIAMLVWMIALGVYAEKETVFTRLFL